MPPNTRCSRPLRAQAQAHFDAYRQRLRRLSLSVSPPPAPTLALLLRLLLSTHEDFIILTADNRVRWSTRREAINNANRSD